MGDAETVALVIVISGIIAVVLWFITIRRGSGSDADVDASSTTTADSSDSATAAVPTGRVEVAAVHHGSDDELGEWVQIVNVGYQAVQLAAWRLTDEGARHEYTFPPLALAPGDSLRIHMWDGDDDANDLYIGRRQHWWNNDGDSAYLYDGQGTLVHMHSYGSAAGSD
jgi:hypothetical protein